MLWSLFPRLSDSSAMEYARSWRGNDSTLLSSTVPLMCSSLLLCGAHWVETNWGTAFANVVGGLSLVLVCHSRLGL